MVEGVKKMTLKELIKKPYWSPKDLSLAMGISLTTARRRISIIRKELESQGFINLDNSKAPTKIILERLNIDLQFIESIGGLDEELNG